MPDMLFKVVRIIGASFPVASSLVQFQSELDAYEFEQRLNNLEDPISSIHPNMGEVGQAIYSRISTDDSVNIQFDEKFYTSNIRCLSLLDAANYISLEKVIVQNLPLGINLTDPTFIIYLASIYEQKKAMLETLYEMVDGCEVGLPLSADSLSHDLELPKVLVCSLFQVYESRNLGICSGSWKKDSYRAIA
ncbi:hypothetical protein [Sessilibacter corallicola]|uniref:Uncharacterized protein n=1 Tax=Sessilibacter corallicola TaxID=2904075 RepID=A0ABQ0ACL5_9GAMM